MKKVLIFLVIIILAVGGYMAFKGLSGGGVSSVKVDNAAQKLLPENVLIYYQMDDLNGSVEKLTSSQIWTELKSVNWDLLLKKSKFSLSQRILWEKLAEQLNEPEFQSAVSKFFGKQVTLALYESEIDYTRFNERAMQNMPALLEDAFAGLFVVTRVGKDIQLAELVSRSFNGFGDAVSTETVEYRGHIIINVTVVQSNLKLSYTRIKDLIVIGLGDHPTKRSIDIIEEKLPSLAGDEKLIEAQKYFVKGADSKGFMNVKRFLGVFQKTINDMAISSGKDISGAQGNLDNAFGKFAGVESVSVSSKWDDILKTKMDMFVDMSKTETQMGRMYANCSNTKNASAALAPKDLIGYQWSYCFDLAYYWDEVKKQQAALSQDNPEVDLAAQISQMEAGIGLSVEQDILPAFGKEFGGFLTDVQAGLIPIPKLSLFVEAASKPKVEKIMSVVLERSPMPVQKETYSDVEINYIPLPLGEMLQPSYAFVDKYLMIAISKSMIKQAIDSSKSTAKSFVGSSGLPDLQLKSDDANVGEYYVRVADLFNKVDGVIEWAFKQAKKRNSQTISLKSGSQKMLADVKKQTASFEADLSKKKDQSVDLKIEISRLKAAGTDVTEKIKERESVLEDIDNLKADIEANKEKMIEVSEIIKGYGDAEKSDVNDREMLDEVVYPILRALKTIDAVGSKSYKTGSVIETLMNVSVQ